MPSFLAWETFHLDSQSSVNCSRKGAFRVVGYGLLAPAHVAQLLSRIHTVKVGRSARLEVADSATDCTLLEAPSSTSSARERAAAPSARIAVAARMVGNNLLL